MSHSVREVVGEVCGSSPHSSQPHLVSLTALPTSSSLSRLPSSSLYISLACVTAFTPLPYSFAVAELVTCLWLRFYFPLF